MAKHFTDSQKHKLYASENTAWAGADRVSEDEARELVRQVWARFAGNRGRAPVLRVSTRASHPWYSPWRHEVVLRPRGIKRWVVFHEVTHALLDGRPIASHGPEYARKYLEVVERFEGFDARQRLALEFRRNNVRTLGESKQRVRRSAFRPRVVRSTHPDGFGAKAIALEARLEALGASLERGGAYSWNGLDGWTVYERGGSSWGCANLYEVEFAADSIEAQARKVAAGKDSKG